MTEDDAHQPTALHAMLHERRSFAPSEEFAARALATADLYEQAAKDPVAWWDAQAHTLEWA